MTATEPGIRADPHSGALRPIVLVVDCFPRRGSEDDGSSSFFCPFSPAAIGIPWRVASHSFIQRLFRSNVCISCPPRSRKNCCVRFFALPGVSLRLIMPLFFDVPAQNIRKSLSRQHRRSRLQPKRVSGPAAGRVRLRPNRGFIPLSKRNLERSSHSPLRPSSSTLHWCPVLAP
jgi:hypothetical protein